MVQIRYGIFETNSSSTMTFAVDICQVEELEIPSVVRIDSNGDHWKRDLNGVYALAVIEQQEEQFLGLLKHAGVKEIYVDGKQVNADPENRRVTFDREEFILAKCFGDFKSFSEWMGHGDEWDYSQYLTKEQIKTVQTYMKNPKYIIICIDADGNEIDWESTRFAKMVITDEEIEAEKEWLRLKEQTEIEKANDPGYKDKYDEYYYSNYTEVEEENEIDNSSWEDDDYFIAKTNRFKKTRKRM